MNNQILLELKQTDATISFNNGDYMVNLPKSVDIEEGDSIILNSAFIDTVATTSDTIILTDDLTVEYTFGYYLTNQDSTNTKHYASYIDNLGNVLTQQQLQDGNKYILCQQHASGALNDYSEIVNYQFEWTFSSANNPPSMIIYFTYINIAGNTVSGNSVIPGSSSQNPPRYYYAPINIIAKNNSFQLTNTQEIIKTGYKIIGFSPAPAPVTADTFEPVLNNFTFTIEKGVYTRSQIAKIINDKCSINSINDEYLTTSPVKSPFLQNSTDYNTGSISTQQYFFVDLKNHSNMFYLDNAKWFGTSQHDLEYDETQQKFYYNYLHIPIYNATGDLIVRYAQNNLINSQVRYKAVGSYSGIFLTNITSTINGVEQHFFENDLGFDFTKELITDINSSALTTKTIGAQSENPPNSGTYIGYIKEAIMPTITLTDGNETTNAYIGLDTGIQKNASYFDVPAFTTASTSESTQSIYASNSISLSGTNTPYFLIDINIPFLNDLITRTGDRKTIYAIVSKYYSLDSYTTKEGSTILYTHIGAPTQLSSFKIRILNPDYTLSDEIGNDNTLFLQINKAQKQIKN